MFDLLPTGLPALAALGIGIFLFVASLLVARGGREREAGAIRSRRSLAGIVVQMAAIALVWAGPQRIVLDPLGAPALAQAALVAVLMATTVALFLTATRAMGRNWSLVARTRSDHALVTTGPFAHLRHPIYTGLFLLLLTVAVATGHEPRLLVGVPLYAVGTWFRVAEEERLLHAMFGGAYAAYAARVRRFVPRLF